MSSREKLVYLLPVFDAATDTHHRHLYDMIEELGERFELVVIVERGSKAEFKNVVETVLLPPSGIRRMLKLWQTLRSLRRRGFSKLYVHYSYPGVIVGRVAGMRIWYWNCGQAWLFPSFSNRYVLKAVIRLAHTLVTGTNFMARGYSTHYGMPMDRIAVMPNWIRVAEWAAADKDQTEEKRLALGIRSDEKVALFVHRLAPRKGTRHLPEIWSGILTDQKVHLVIAGDGPDRAWLENERAKSPLKDRIHFLGAVNNKKMPPLFHLSDVFIMPSLEEGFPRSALEAMATGVPIVAFDTGGLEEILPPENMPFIYPVGQCALFIEGVKKILASREVVRAEVLQQQAARFDLLSVVKIFANLLQEKI